MLLDVPEVLIKKLVFLLNSKGYVNEYEVLLPRSTFRKACKEEILAVYGYAGGRVCGDALEIKGEGWVEFAYDTERYTSRLDILESVRMDLANQLHSSTCL